MNRSRRFTAAAAIVVALAVTPALSGCFGNPLENTVRDALKDSGIEFDANNSQDGGPPSLPADFPVAHLLPQGTLTEATKVTLAGVQNWFVTVEVGDLESVWESTVEAFLAAGYEGNSGIVTESGAITTLTGEYTVGMIGAVENDGSTIIFNVSDLTQKDKNS